MPDASFIDTNIWIYAHLREPGDTRHSRALALVEQLQEYVISPQVVLEYYNVMLRNQRDDRWIQQNLSRILEYVRLQPIGRDVVQRTWTIRQRFGFSIWDSQILAAALMAGCTRLYSEDLQHGQRIDSLTIINPFEE
uniref:Ribonuclease VapC n=1 Tax=Candidatus Kentrum sp. FM TaxID=2126340 RepID=A0A450W132_9GAMM|nr:MAG: Predicted nucleic acid-binding protein, contains PIN domain [Candidatus Kentron sp. FM]VFJ56261.1 MAG: Predicted nucleic acid-binding protein, contains PIN domain [Candidatus Kentron sp. FM]VFK10750.1 MAG: Predicted nucleic acid-binding protein, contains PIN domain [Candidatus Kentron sp. FM]